MDIVGGKARFKRAEKQVLFTGEIPILSEKILQTAQLKEQNYA